MSFRATLTFAFLFTLLGTMPADAQSRASGVVYEDANGNGVRDSGEPGIAGVHVSNGQDIVSTNDAGEYSIGITNDTIIFVIKPSGYATARDENNLPRFYYIHKPAGSPKGKYPGVEPTGPLPESVDFALTRSEEPTKFDVIMFGDPQPRNETEVNYIAHDIVQELVGTSAAFGVTLGDIVFNDLTVFGPYNEVVGTIGAPWYSVIGNHDLNMDVDDDDLSDETFERLYGPNYYSYNYGGVHFVVLDNVKWVGSDNGGYSGEFGARQLQFIKNDLKTVDKDALVCYMFHIPLPSVTDKGQFLDAIEDHASAFSVSAHWHRQGHFAMGEDEGFDGDGPHRHLVHGTVSGSWWSGLKDEWDIPQTLMRDGTPNGYSIATFEGNSYSFRYKASRRPADFQMSIHAPHVAPSEDPAQDIVVANVFMGSDEAKVYMQVGDSDEWIEMTQSTRPDPYFKMLKDREHFLPPAAGRSLPSIVDSPHIWVAPLPKDLPRGAHVIHVKATDLYGQVHHGRRIIRVKRK